MTYTNIEIIYRLPLGTHFIVTQALNKILNLFCEHSYCMGFIQFKTNILYIISVYNKDCNFKHILHYITSIK